jgi:signal transduction histidine kinase
MALLTNKTTNTSFKNHIQNFSEIGRLICSVDWSKSLGDIDTWPNSLKTALGMVLTSCQPTAILWGPDLVFIYNEAYIRLLGSTHPKALGQPYLKYCDERSIVTQEMLERMPESPHEAGCVKCRDDERFIMENEPGLLTEAYFTVYISPIYNESCAVGGLLISGTETTKRVLALRRSTLLRELSLANKKTVNKCCRNISKVFDSSPFDIPFSLIYLVQQDGDDSLLVLQSCTGISAGTKASPKEIRIAPDTDDATCWPVYSAMQNNSRVLVEDLKSRFGEDWSLTARALVLPINVDESIKSPQGVLVMGINPTTTIDDADYRLFTTQIVLEANNILGKARLIEKTAFKSQEIATISQAKTVFFTNVSHEFRTPLSLMLGPLADLLTDKENPPNTVQRERLLMIQRNSLRLVKLVNSIMDFSRIEAGRSKMTYQPTNLTKLTKEIGSLFEAALFMAGLDFVIDIETIDQPVYVDPEMWEKITMNLLSNAFKFTLQGKIELILKRSGNDVTLKVIDTGVGMSDDDMKSIFQRYHQVDKRKGRSAEGSGIGLSLIHELVQLHEGTVSVSSKVNSGTTFTVTIPMTPKSATTPKETSMELSTVDFVPTAYSLGIVKETQGWIPEFKVEHHVSREEYPSQQQSLTMSTVSSCNTVLLAEDNADMRDYIRRILTKHWNVDVIDNGQKAYELACTNDFQLIISDIFMPKVDGLGLIRLLRTNPKTRGIPIILLTARAGEEALANGLEFGADDYLVKLAFSEKELIARSKKHIELGQFRRYLERRVEEKTGELQQLDTAFYDFVDMLCHEIRNPIHGISGNWELLMERFDLLEKAWKESLAENMNVSEIQQSLITYLSEMKSYLVNIEVCTTHQTAVIDEVVLRAKLRRNNYEITYSVFDPVVLLNDSIKRFHTITETLGFKIQIISGEISTKVQTDAYCVKLVLQNLLGTMIRNMDTGGIITISFTVFEETELRLQLTCTHFKKSVVFNVDAVSFDSQLTAKSMGERYDNASFGLSICNRLISLVGGKHVRVTRTEDRTLCLDFTVFCKPVPKEQQDIPKSLQDYAVKREVSKPKIRVPTKRALVAEDNIINQTLCKALLTKQGYECIIAKDGKEALEKFVPEAYDFILMDITMPELNGFEVTKRIREIEAAMEVDNPVSIIGLSAYSQQDKIDAAVDAGMDDFISKPATFAKIVNIIEQSLGGSDRRKSKDDLFNQNSGSFQNGSLSKSSSKF